MKRISDISILLAAALTLACAKIETGADQGTPAGDKSVSVDAGAGDMESGDVSDAYPYFGDTLVVDMAGSSLPAGAVVSDDGRNVVLSHLPADFVLAVSGDEELELQQPDNHLLSAEPVAGEINRFRIRKGLYAPNVPAETAVLEFRRKGLSNVYPEDAITLELSANPVVVRGEMNFDTDGNVYDFGRYVDNELGVFVIPEGKGLSVEFSSGEDPWVKLVQSESGAWRVLGGWRPNDPGADGRSQSATIVVSNSDGTDREEYTVVRRNYGLPVTWMHGVWWCKYNAMGNSMDFDDQILVPEDPAAVAGQTLFEYLTSCSSEEYAALWGWAYQGDSGQGMRVVESDGMAVMDGFSMNVPAHINKLPAGALAPDGYELPSMEEFNRIFDATDYIWMMWNGTHTLKTPWEGSDKVQREQRRKNGIAVGSLTLDDLIYIRMWSPSSPEHEPIVWYGPGAQWNTTDGIRHANHYNNILFGVYSPEGSGWYMAGGMSNLYMHKNGAGTRDTRILRFKKSDVEYIY